MLRILFQSNLYLLITPLAANIFENLLQRCFLIAFEDKPVTAKRIQGAQRVSCAVVLFVNAFVGYGKSN